MANRSVEVRILLSQPKPPGRIRRIKGLFLEKRNVTHFSFEGEQPFVIYDWREDLSLPLLRITVG
jgi:hypothetical protein